MDNFPPLNNSQNNNSFPSGPLRPGEGDMRRNVPPPPPPPIAIRTMDSDVKSMAQTGGSAPLPQRFDMNQQPQVKTMPTMPETPRDVKINIPGYEGPEEKLFSPETLTGTEEVMGDKKKFGSRTIFFIVIFIFIAGGLGAAGYFLYPVFFPASVTPVATPDTVTPPPVVTPPATTLKHNSYITSDGATGPVLSLGQVTAPTMASGTKPILKEIIFQDANGSQPTFSKYFSSKVTDFLETDLQAIFSDDFTTFVYYTEQGSWPGYVAKLKAGVSPDAVLNMEKKMEGFSTLINLFLSNPGDKSPAGFKNGNLNGSPSRYLTYSAKDAAINYSIIGNYFLISTNYAGATEAAKRLITSSPTSTTP